MDQRAFGLAMGAVYAIYMALLAWAGAFLHVGGSAIAMIKAFYPGYGPTFLGGLIGAAYGAVTGFALGWGIGWLYNLIGQSFRLSRRGSSGHLSRH